MYRASAALSVLLLAASCALTGTVGSGVRADETRSPGEFRHLSVAGSFDVVVTSGAEDTVVKLSGDDNLLAHVVTEVRDDTLVVHFEDGSYHQRADLRVEVSAPLLLGVQLAGSCDIEVRGVHGASFRVGVAGSGDVRAEGQVEELIATVAGSGDLDLKGLTAQRAKVSISGSGDVEVRAVEVLTAGVAGSGDVCYYGHPTVNWSSAGSGDLRFGGE